eukprot:CAMPEP_0117440480 /NCGR_PEP_ID=MMETSP0759-20121206/3120_1 /TAXON_ID=63605 /ORGANISM="Percolomonas cosmopolitus, Strain WS" /LENGTH=579 /DNA_ID=CAMNT_0005232263 /DNA_START=569 /DNA_END=2305 /DNA_ORIENTATION=-
MVQFHFLFYASRPLPNVLALSWVLFAQGHWIRRNFLKCFFVMGFTAVVFRGELFVLIAPMALIAIACGWVSVFLGGISGLLGMSVGISVSLVVDSWFWQRVLWAEGEVLFYNTFMNKSREWGIMAWHWYFSSALPRSLLFALPLAFLGIALLGISYKSKPFNDRSAHKDEPHIAYSKRAPVLALGITSLIFVALYSQLPHKELRFIFYVIPCFNIVAAVAVEFLWSYPRGSVRLLTRLSILSMLVFSLAATTMFYYASSLNYFGADALTQLHELELNSTKPKLVHLDAHTTMNGVNRFIHQNTSLWQYTKEENYPDYSLYSHLLTGTPENFLTDFEVIGTQNGFDGISLREFRVRTAPKIFILRRKGFNTFDREKVDQELAEFKMPAGCRQPNLKWAQKKGKITIHAQIYGARDAKHLLNSLGLRLYANDSRSKTYCISLKFFAPIDETQSTVEILKSKIRITLTKKYAGGGKMWPRLLKDKKTPSYLKINWDEWSLEEDEIEIREVFSNLHGETKRGKQMSAPLHDSAVFTASWTKKLGITPRMQQKYLNLLNRYLTVQRVAWGSLLFAVGFVVSLTW